VDWGAVLLQCSRNMRMHLTYFIRQKMKCLGCSICLHQASRDGGVTLHSSLRLMKHCRRWVLLRCAGLCVCVGSIHTFTEEFIWDGGRAYPDNILVQSKVASVCPGIIPEDYGDCCGLTGIFYHLLQETSSS